MNYTPSPLLDVFLGILAIDPHVECDGCTVTLPPAALIDNDNGARYCQACTRQYVGEQ
jgi:hypothetical protein